MSNPTAGGPTGAVAPTNVTPGVQATGPTPNAQKTNTVNNAVMGSKPPAPVKAPAKQEAPEDGSEANVEANEGDTQAEQVQEEIEELIEAKVNGKTKKLTQAQLLAEYQKLAAGGEKFKEAADLTKKNQALLKLFQSDPEAALEQMGVDIDALANDRLSRKVNEQLLSPEERQQISEREELEYYRNQSKQRQEQEAQEQEQQADNLAFSQFEQALLGEAEKAGLSNDPSVLYGINEIGIEWMEMGFNDWNEASLIQEYQHRQEQRSLAMEKREISKLKGEPLLSYVSDHFGEAFLTELLNATVAKYNATAAYSPEPVEEPVQQAPAERTYTTEAEYLARMKAKK